jgi:Zn-dependent protease with chaperone function
MFIQVNAFTAGVERPIVVVTSGAVDLLTHEELAFLIGHELGHIKSGHVLYHQMADILPLLGSIVASATLGMGGLVSTGIQLALLNWYRMSEFPADRAGLLVCKTPRPRERADESSRSADEILRPGFRREFP